MTRDGAKKSKLVKLLQRVSHGVTPRIGLVPAPEEKVPAMLLVVSLEQGDAQTLSEVAAAGADALAVSPEQGIAKWDELVKAAGNKPIGFVLGDRAGSADELKKDVECGPDFVIAAAGTAPAALLSNTDVGKVITLDDSYPPQLVRALGELPVDALLVEAAENGKAGTLTIRDLLYYRQAVDLVRRPVVVLVESLAITEVLPALRDMGVEGLLLRVPGATKPDGLREEVAALRKAIDGLGRPVGRSREGERGPALPRIVPGAPFTHEEPEEEPDDE